MFTKHPGPDVVGSAKSIMAQKRRITIKDIAEMAGTSKTTVSFYLNGKTERMSEGTQQRITPGRSRRPATSPTRSRAA